MILRNVQIISNLASDLLNFAKDRVPDLEPSDLTSLVDEVVDSLGVDRDGPVKVRVEKGGSVPRVMLDEHAFHQCLTNLLHNALEAFPEGQEGTVVVTTESAGDRAMISVCDNGAGMNQETIARIKNGMFSTKGSKGTGLGLQVVQKIVNEHRGTLTIESEEGKGSVFRIEVPVGELPAMA
jgi:signal transduction histidine kinase